MIVSVRQFFVEIDKIKGNNLKRIRLELGMTQREIGEIINDSEGNVSAMENAKRTLTDRKIDILCKRFNIHPYEFYIEEDTPLIKDDLEKETLYILREAKALGDVVAENIPKYGRFVIQETKKAKEKGVRKGRKVRIKAG